MACWRRGLLAAWPAGGVIGGRYSAGFGEPPDPGQPNLFQPRNIALQFLQHFEITSMASSAAAATIRGATVTTEDGGRLNAFATEPRMEVVSAESGWGFHERAEKLNGRMAMLGFIALLATEFALGGEAFTRGLLGLG
jgi:hypothetical protein